MQQYTIVFLLNAAPPSKLVVLQRSADKDYAPNQVTGIGGHVEPGEAVIAAAYRELEEETSINTVTLTEFACCVVDAKIGLHYFWGLFNAALPDCNEGTLLWVRPDALFDLPIIPDTAHVLREWQKRDFDLEQTWTLYVRRIATQDALVERVVEGLVVV
mgnify:CR=1 FL=1|jgi:8-oxo-dGTP pyrophosphatase MutT (NUDIX family)